MLAYVLYWGDNMSKDTNEFLKAMNSKTRILFSYSLNLIDMLNKNIEKLNLNSEDKITSTMFALGFFLSGIKYNPEIKELFESHNVTFDKCMNMLLDDISCQFPPIKSMEGTTTYKTYDFNVFKNEFTKKLKERLMIEDKSLSVSDIEFYQIFYFIVTTGRSKIEPLLKLCGCNSIDELYEDLNKLILKNDLEFINKIQTENYKNLYFDNVTLYFYDDGKVTLKLNDDKESIELKCDSNTIQLEIPNESEVILINGKNDFSFVTFMNEYLQHKKITLLLKDCVDGHHITAHCDTKSLFNVTRTQLNEQSVNSTHNMETPTPYLEKYGTELTKSHYIKDPSIGRVEELKRVEQVLLYPEKDKSVVIVGEAGCGKTALVRGLAYRVQNGDVPNALKNIRIFSVSVSSLVAGTKYVGTLEEKMRNILTEASKDKNIILFIDEIHQAIGGGKAEGNNNTVSEILKPYIDYGDVRIISATTVEEYDKYIQSDTAFKTRLKKVKVEEPDNSVIYDILDDLINVYNEISFSKLSVSPEEKTFIINWLIESTQKKYRTYNDRSSNPRLVLDIIKEAYAIAAINDRENVTREDLCEALMNEDRLYESSKANQCKKLEGFAPKKEACRIIKFVPKKRDN